MPDHIGPFLIIEPAHAGLDPLIIGKYWSYIDGGPGTCFCRKIDDMDLAHAHMEDLTLIKVCMHICYDEVPENAIFSISIKKPGIPTRYWHLLKNKGKSSLTLLL